MIVNRGLSARLSCFIMKSGTRMDSEGSMMFNLRQMLQSVCLRQEMDSHSISMN